MTFLRLSFCTVAHCLAALFSAATLCSLPLFGASLSTPFEAEDAAVLPVNIRSPRLKNIYTFGETRFEGSGNQVGVGQALNKKLFWSDLVKAQKDDTQKALFQGSLKSLKIADSQLAGQVTGNVNVFVNAEVPVLAMGVTEQWTLALAVPVYNVHTSVKTGFVAAPQVQTFINDLNSSNPATAIENGQKLVSPLSTKVKDLGYKPLENQDFSALGDAKVVSKYQFYKNDTYSVAVKTDLTLPTGHGPDADQLIDVPTGDGHYALGIGLNADQQWTGKFSTNIFGSTQLHQQDHLQRRIPTASNDPLSEDTENVGRTTGRQYTGGFNFNYGTGANGLSLGWGVIYQYLEPTTFTGSKFSSIRYHYLNELNPSQQLISHVGRVSYSTIHAYQAKEFAVPLQAHLSMGRPISGRNVTAAQAYLAEMVLFF